MKKKKHYKILILFKFKFFQLPKNSTHEFQVIGDGLQADLVKVVSNKVKNLQLIRPHLQF